MAVLRRRRRRGVAAIGFGALIFALLPNSIGFQDLGALLVRQPGVAARAYRHVINSPFGTIHAATFSMPRPIGTIIPHPPLYALANFDPTDVTGSISSQFLGDPTAPLQFPTVNRKSKRDSALARSRQPLPPMPPLLSIEPVTPAQTDAALKRDEASGRFDPYSEYDFAAVADEQLTPPNIQPSSADQSPGRKGGSRIYFGADPLAAVEAPISLWAPGERPVALASGDPDIKHSALIPPLAGGADKAGASVAHKGEVTGVEQRPKSPAES
jgi:hypothetical protein